MIGAGGTSTGCAAIGGAPAATTVRVDSLGEGGRALPDDAATASRLDAAGATTTTRTEGRLVEWGGASTLSGDVAMVGACAGIGAPGPASALAIGGAGDGSCAARGGAASMAALGRALLAVAVAGEAWVVRAGGLSLSTGRFSGETARDWWHPIQNSKVQLKGDVTVTSRAAAISFHDSPEL